MIFLSSVVIRIPWNLSMRMQSIVIHLIFIIHRSASPKKRANLSLTKWMTSSSRPTLRSYSILRWQSKYIIIISAPFYWFIIAILFFSSSSLCIAILIYAFSKHLMISFFMIKFCLTENFWWLWLLTSNYVLESYLIGH